MNSQANGVELHSKRKGSSEEDFQYSPRGYYCLLWRHAHPLFNDHNFQISIYLQSLHFDTRMKLATFFVATTTTVKGKLRDLYKIIHDNNETIFITKILSYMGRL